LNEKHIVDLTTEERANLEVRLWGADMEGAW